MNLSQLRLPIKWENNTFLPFDYAQYAFIYDKNKLTNPPKSLKELVERQDLKVLYQDPRTSSIDEAYCFDECSVSRSRCRKCLENPF